MCIAFPGKIIKIHQKRATVEYPGETRGAKIVTGSYKVGDYVIVQAGLVIDKVPKAQVTAWQRFIAV